MSTEEQERVPADPLDPVNDAADIPGANADASACFTTFELAQTAAIGGIKTVIAVHYVDAYHEGDTLTIYVTNGVGCRNGAKYQKPNLPTWIDNEISSTYNYAGCGHVKHFDYKKFYGPQYDCSPCGYMGAMNDETSSVKYQP
ncbi:MAG TPA: hypothetical protein VIG64_06700 [Actinomycetota bacterium]